MKSTDRIGCLDDIPSKFTVTVKEVRLMAYLNYLLQNSLPVDPRKITQEERELLQKWRDEGKITFSATDPCTSTKEFWMDMCEILFHSYVLEKQDNASISETS